MDDLSKNSAKEPVAVRQSRRVPALIGRRCLVLFCSMWLWVVASAGDIVGFQTRQQDEENEALLDSALIDENSVFVQASRETLRPLIRAEKAIGKQEYERAVELLGGLLTQPDLQDYLVKIPGEYGSVTSLRYRAQALLGQVPRDVRRLFEVRYGIEAKQMLKQAVADRDLTKISEVMKRFFYTEAGYEAAMVAGYLHLELGRPVAAGQCFQRIVSTPDARVLFDPEASILLATCWVLTNSPEQAKKVLVSMATSRKSITFNRQEVPLFQKPEEAIAWLHNLIGDSPLTQNELVREWVMFRGNAQRNTRSGTGFPLGIPLWSLPTTLTNDQSVALERYEQELMNANSSTVPVVQPLAVGNTVVIRMVDRIAGVDFQTGKVQWTYPGGSKLFSQQRDSVRIKDNLLNQQAFSQRMWSDHIFGQMTSDRNSIFVVPNPGSAGQLAYLGEVDRKALFDPLRTREFNELVAIDVENEGAVNWRIGGEDGIDEPRLAGTFFLGPPLPLDGQLLAVCQQKKLIQLVALDPNDGRLLWQQQLASTEKPGSGE